MCRTSQKESRVREYLASETLPKLTEEEVRAIDEAGSKIHHRAFVSRTSLDSLKAFG